MTIHLDRKLFIVHDVLTSNKKVKLFKFPLVWRQVSVSHLHVILTMSTTYCCLL